MIHDNARSEPAKKLVERARLALLARGVPLVEGDRPGFAVVWGGYCFGAEGGWLSLAWSLSALGPRVATPDGHDEAARVALRADGFRAVWSGGERHEIMAWLGPA